MVIIHNNKIIITNNKQQISYNIYLFKHKHIYNKHFSSIMNKQMLTYLQQDQIGKVIAKGLASVYTTKPQTPVKYLAQWLQKYSQNQKQLHRLEKEAVKTNQNLKLFNMNIQLEKQRKKLNQEEQRKYDHKIQEFKNMIANSQYQEELLDQQFPQFIQKLYGLTGAYVGELNHPKKTISQQDTDQNAHLDTTIPKLINFIGSSKSHKQLMVGKTLPLDKGVTGKVFELSLQDPPQQIGQDGNVIPQQKKQKYIYIPNVVKNQNIHYFRLPKLGAYIALPLTYNSYLTEKIFDVALDTKRKQNQERADFLKVKAEALQQLKGQKQQLQKKVAELTEKNSQQSAIEPIKQQLTQVVQKINEKEAQQFIVEAVVFPLQKREYVFCADNLGSDQEIALEQRQFILNLVNHFRISWQNKQQQLLNKDVQNQLAYESKYLSEPAQSIIEQINNQLELDQEITREIDAIENQNLKNYKGESWVVQKLRKIIKQNEKYLNAFISLKQFRVIKFRQLLQNVLYFNGKRKQQINIPGKAVIDWKKVRHNYINKELFNNILDYVIQGPKTGEFTSYGKINSIIQRLQSFQQNDIFDYNIGLAIISKFIVKALRHRISNIELRKVQKQQERKKREEIIAQNQKITQDKQLALQKHKASLPVQEVQSFSEQEWSKKFDQQNPLKQVPDQIVDDIDNDF